MPTHVSSQTLYIASKIHINPISDYHRKNMQFQQDVGPKCNPKSNNSQFREGWISSIYRAHSLRLRLKKLRLHSNSPPPTVPGDSASIPFAFAVPCSFLLRLGTTFM
jgi:hypothetical protein